MVALSEAAVEADLAEIVKIARETHGLEDAEAKVQRFRDLVIKWEGLLPLDREWTPEEIADAICFMISNSAVSGQLWADAGWHGPA